MQLGQYPNGLQRAKERLQQLCINAAFIDDHIWSRYEVSVSVLEGGGCEIPRTWHITIPHLASGEVKGDAMHGLDEAAYLISMHKAARDVPEPG